MAYQDPINLRRTDDYIERTGGMGLTPIVLGLVFVSCSDS